ncbi:hypothetical protein EJ06DRAFT_369851 [Trichodelitschia bisporula]|uniref:Uncharacterized protein n=1 Tax=Trichodelitschia bisporula TaxID=703511 RepID=A0A6G1I1V8_9PEZI|nr:hypothetical protein EJ06DRAFT_369851 [Trichodelitschia bisporula]
MTSTPTLSNSYICKTSPGNCCRRSCSGWPNGYLKNLRINFLQISVLYRDPLSIRYLYSNPNHQSPPALIIPSTSHSHSTQHISLTITLDYDYIESSGAHIRLSRNHQRSLASAESIIPACRPASPRITSPNTNVENAPVGKVRKQDSRVTANQDRRKPCCRHNLAFSNAAIVVFSAHRRISTPFGNISCPLRHTLHSELPIMRSSPRRKAKNAIEPETSAPYQTHQITQCTRTPRKNTPRKSATAAHVPPDRRPHVHPAIKGPNIHHPQQSTTSKNTPHEDPSPVRISK